MTYNEISAGGIRVHGCAIITKAHIYTTLYGVGDIVYNIDKAKMGILEKVVIKELIQAKPKFTSGIFVVLYKDTLNALWNEYDLVTYEDAKALAETYYENLLADLAKIQAKKQC
jgi:hypothetical protein